MSKPVVAIVGRPNVGKSSLFNALYGERISIVHDTPGVTRDRIYANTVWREREFVMIDTGGIEPESDDVILQGMRMQAEIAIETADVILFMVDLKTGMTAADEEIALMLRKADRPIVVAVNKCDSVGAPPPEIYEFYNLGLGDVVPISASHRLGIGEMLDKLFENFPSDEDEGDSDGSIRVALIGRPNAGKSSLTNIMCGQARSIVSDVAGTTRDSIDSEVVNKFGRFTIVDTAGMRKKGRIEDVIEKYSMVRALAAVEHADVCVILIDASMGVTEQDTKVAGLAHDSGKACILAVNKWDIVDKETGTLEAMTKIVKDRFSFMDYAPVLFISAKTGQRVDKLFVMINNVYEQANRRLSTGVFNDMLNEAVAMVPPPQDKGRHMKIYYGTQVSICPPTFVLFVNDKELSHFSYERYLENQVRKNFGFEGTPIRFLLRNKNRTDS
ncbi:MAG: ribosome biogenesis GTPase Der [Saccharofermentanaceae bacterium]|jgi:GTP-binding protein|nr:ribosome biogenesis GTPase Der [Clostridia bacterium]NLX68163.1 ribosome biogenesis GTPase Der [Clostridiaceae bacterium]HOO48942.1 ribosome biogenesis GTPase Der [Saccharofermentans sp.]HPE27647.1 ribosome biogenesis GTPase Der [Saccharofermentans sp.]HPG64524.1 ribosome biogenesis GTPase Der [Saccharofermentans sp.]